MAIYHLSIKIITRGTGKSAVAAAAYRAAETISNERDGVTHDYTRKGGIVHTEIMLPEYAPAAYSNRATLWNAVEKSERYCNAQLARDIDIALPKELTREQGIALVREYVKQTFVSAGMCADVCVHDTDGKNPHAHVMLTMRPINADGTWGQKSRTVGGRKIPSVDWNDRDKAEVWRAAWEGFANAALEQTGSGERVCHKSYERQGLDTVPTVHLGPAASQMERKGIRTVRGDRNRQKPNRKEAYFEAHRREITLYEAAERYLTPVLNGHPLNLKKWKAERSKKATEKERLYQQYYALKEKTRNVETIRRTVADVLREGAAERVPQREWGVEL